MIAWATLTGCLSYELFFEAVGRLCPSNTYKFCYGERRLVTGSALEACERVKQIELDDGAPGAPVVYQDRLYRLAGFVSDWRDKEWCKLTCSGGSERGLCECERPTDCKLDHLCLASPDGGLSILPGLEGLFLGIEPAQSDELEVAEDIARRGRIDASIGHRRSYSYLAGPVAPLYRGLLKLDNEGQWVLA
jgi:hypothetical protein